VCVHTAIPTHRPNLLFFFSILLFSPDLFHFIKEKKKLFFLNSSKVVHKVWYLTLSFFISRWLTAYGNFRLLIPQAGRKGRPPIECFRVKNEYQALLRWGFFFNFHFLSTMWKAYEFINLGQQQGPLGRPVHQASRETQQQLLCEGSANVSLAGFGKYIYIIIIAWNGQYLYSHCSGLGWKKNLKINFFFSI
jgi:hypothetical protein